MFDLETKKIKMKIKSNRYDVEEALFSKSAATLDIEDEIEYNDDEFDSSQEPIVLNTEGVMNIDDKRVELVYEESEITGMEGSRTSVYFDIDTPGFVSMLRSGAISTSLLFEKGKRHHCVYNTPIMPFEICVRTLKVENDILSKGTLKLDYIIEIRGAKAERTKFELSLCEVS